MSFTLYHCHATIAAAVFRRRHLLPLFFFDTAALRRCHFIFRRLRAAVLHCFDDALRYACFAAITCYTPPL